MSERAERGRELLAGLVDASVRDDEDLIEDRLARVRWSVMTEPGDSVAGRLVQALGAPAALRLALCPGGDGGAERAGVSGAELERARARWLPRRDDHRHPLVLARRAGARLIAPTDPEWPSRLDDLGAHAPHLLWARGSTDVLSAPAHAAAIVGARAATAYGTHAAFEIGADLAASGVTIVSGAAVGIDAAAHRASIATRGPGIAVLAGGVDKAYPSGHGELLTALSERGVVISEVPCGTAPTKWRFLQRNRAIAALGDATVVVEAGWRSGSLNTAGHAAALGRPLGAVPGPITSASSAGCHRILREFDGVCVTSGDDVRELMGIDAAAGGDAGRDDQARTGDRSRVIDAMSARSPRSPAEIARRAGMAADEVTAVLGLLSLEARVRASPEGWVLGR